MIRRLTWGVLAGAVLAGGLVAAPASASAQVSELVLTIKPHNGGAVRQVTLTCEPTGGDHPDAAGACKDLAAVDGFIEQIPPTGVPCPTVYDPVTAHATGHWRKRLVEYEQVFTNECGAVQETGGRVFNLGKRF